MQLNGIMDINIFLNLLSKKNIHYKLDHHRDDTIMVTITLVGIRLEVDFFEDHIEYSWFTGDESVHDDQKKLFAMLAENFD